MSRSAVAVLVLGVIGCGKQAESHEAEDPRWFALDQTNEMYRLFVRERQQLPAQLDDMQPYAEGYSNAYLALQNGDVILVWGTRIDGTKTLLAYARETPVEGGHVLWSDGVIEKISAEAFRAAKSP